MFLQDIKLGVKGLVTKPKEGAKQGGKKGFIKGVGKGFLGLIGRPTSGIADLTSTSFNLIKRLGNIILLFEKILFFFKQNYNT